MSRSLACALVGFALLAGCARSAPVENGAAAATELLTAVTATGSHEFRVEIADDDAERERGLMYRAPLPDDGGMLFEFPRAREQTFWMHNTPSPLDIIYIAPDGRIVSIAANAVPYSDAQVPSYGAANGVLEIRGGRAAEIGLKAGDVIRHPFFHNR